MIITPDHLRQALAPTSRPPHLGFEVETTDTGQTLVQTPYCNPGNHGIYFTLQYINGRSRLTDNGEWWSESWMHGRAPDWKIIPILEALCATQQVKIDIEEMWVYIDSIDGILPAVIGITNTAILVAGAIYVPKGVGCKPEW